MNIGLYKFDDVDYKNIKSFITKNTCDVMVLTIDFSQNKKQIEHLLFFDKLAKCNNQFVIILDIDYNLCNLKNIIVLDKKTYKIILPDFVLGGFVIRYNNKKLPFVIGDNIYKKAYRDFVYTQKYHEVFHIDLFGEGYIKGNNLLGDKIKVISTQKEGIYRLKK